MSYGHVIEGTLEDANRLAELLLASSVIIVGPPGVGKSAMARMVAKLMISLFPEEKQGKILCVPAPQIGITDLSLPHVVEGKHELVVNADILELILLARERKACVLVIDDLSWADPLMRPSWLGITDTTSPQIMFHTRPKLLRIICTANTPQGYDPGNALIAPQVSRASMFLLLPSPDSFAANFANYWGNPHGLPDNVVAELVDVSSVRRWREAISSFLLFHNRQDFIFTTTPPLDGQLYPSPRGWDSIAVGMSIKVGRGAVYPSQAPANRDKLESVVRSLMPENVAAAFISYVLAFGQIADINEIMKRPELVHQYKGQQMALEAIAGMSSLFMSYQCEKGEHGKHITGWANLVEILYGISPALAYSSSVWLVQLARTEEGRRILERKSGGKTIADRVPPAIVRYIGETMAAGKKI